MPEDSIHPLPHTGDPDDITLDVPPYPQLRTIYIGGIFFLLLFAALHFASSIAIPIALAFILKLVFRPIHRRLEAMHIPSTLAALMVVLLLVGATAGLAIALSAPASSWIEKLSDGMPQIRERLNFLKEPMQSAQKIIVNAENIAQPEAAKVMPVAISGTRLYDRMFISTREFASSLAMTVVMLFFLLVSGDTFLRRLVEILPRFSEKRQAVNISQQIEQDISKYLLTITTMNVLVGIATGGVMALCGREDAILWGTVAFMLNYVPIIGPIICFTVFAVAGLLLDQTLGVAALPALLYLGIHVAESSFITPLLLAKRFTLNPVLVMLSLLFWYWLWGLAGAILAMPMLAIAKIICDRTERLKPLGHFLEN